MDSLEKMHLGDSEVLKNYADVLLFLCAYPDDPVLMSKADREIKRITGFLKKNKAHLRKGFVNSGLPHTRFVSSFSHDFLSWLNADNQMKLEIDRFENTSFTLNEVLKLTLPTLEKSETTAGLSDTGLMDVLMVKRKSRIQFLLSELGKLNNTPYLKDHLFDGLGLYTGMTSGSSDFSLFYNRLSNHVPYYHKDLMRFFDHLKLFRSRLPAPASLSAGALTNAVKVVKNSMALTDRETDPVTYMDCNSFRLYHLERGISIAIYGMIPGRQLALESYVGYTLFKNGFPAAYGGSWVFGECANFGINIFEQFRGGESGYFLCQLLRVYRQVFKVSYFEIEPYQFGLDNPEGIASGAFWFYYRYGFRPLDNTLASIADQEYQRIKKNKEYRTSKKVLVRFTESTLVLKLDEKIPVKVPDISARVIRLIERNYHGDRVKAVQGSVKKFERKTKSIRDLADSRKQVLEEVALWAEACNVKYARKLNFLKQMIRIKPTDLYRYQELLLRFFSQR